MKIKKILLAIVSTVAVILIAAYFVLTSSGFQTSLVNKYLKDAFPGSEVELVKITPSNLRIENLKIKNVAPGKDFSADSLDGEISLFGLLSRQIRITNPSLRNAVLKFNKLPDYAGQNSEQSVAASKSESEISKAKSDSNAASSGSDKPAQEAVELPNFDIIVKNLNAELLVILEDGSKVDSKLKVDTFRTKNLIKAYALDASLNCDFDIVGKAKDSIALRATLAPDGNRLSLKSSLEKGEKKLLKLDAKLDSEYSNIDGKVQLTADSRDFENILKNTPFFDANIFCDIRASSDLKDAGLNGSFKLNAKNLDILSETLKPISDISLSGEVSANKRGDELSVANAQVLGSINGLQVLNLKNTKAFKISAKDMSNVPDGELLTLDILNVDDSLINPFLKDITLKSSKISTQIILTKSGDKFEIKTSKPFSILRASVSSKDSEFVRDLNLTLSAIASIDDKSASADLNLSLKPESAKEGLSAELKLSQFLFAEMSAKASLELKGQIAAFLPSDFNKGDIPELDALIEISANKKLLEISQARVDLLSKNNAKIFELGASDKILIDISEKKLLSENLQIRAIAEKFPFEIIKPYAKGADADHLNIDLTAKVANKNSATASAKISLVNLSFKNADELLVSDLNTSALIEAKLDGNRIAVELKDFELNGQNVPFAKIAATAEADLQSKEILKSASAKISATLPALLRQPALEKFNNLSSGMAEVEAQYKPESAELNLTLHNIAPRFYDQTLAKLELNTKVKLDNNTPKVIDSTLKTGGTSGATDADLNVKLGEVIDLALSAREICADEFITLAKAFTKSDNQPQKTVLEGENPEAKKEIYRPKAARESSAVAASTQSYTPDKKALWDFSKSVNLTCDIGKILLGGKDVVNALKFDLSLNPRELKLTKLSATAYGANIAANSKLSFAENSGYELSDTTFDMSGLEVGQFLKPNESGDRILVGKFDAKASVKGQSRNLQTLAKNIQAEVQLSSDSGTLTLLDKNSISGIGTNIGSIALKATGDILGDKVKGLSGAGDLLSMLQTLNYSKINLSAKRGEDLNIELSDCTIETDDFLIKAKGKLSYDESIEFMQSKIDVPVNIYAKRGNVAELLKSCGFVDENETIKGYSNGPSFKVYGKLASPQNNLKDVILESVKGSLGDAGDSASEGVKEGINALGGFLKSLKKL